MDKREVENIIDEMIKVAPKNANALILGSDMYDLIESDIVNGMYKEKEVYTHAMVESQKAVLSEGSFFERFKESCENFLNES